MSCPYADGRVAKERASVFRTSMNARRTKLVAVLGEGVSPSGLLAVGRTAIHEKKAVEAGASGKRFSSSAALAVFLIAV